MPLIRVRSMVQVHHGPIELCFGGIAQLVERCFCTAEVSGSIPLISKTFLSMRLNIYGPMLDSLKLNSEEGRSY